MGWLKFSDSRAMNRKLREAGFEARGLDEAAICQVGRDMTDGFIATATVEMLAAAHRCRHWKRLVSVLETVGRWEQTEGGWMIHDYLEYNPSKADWTDLKNKKSQAGSIGGRKSAQARAQAPASSDAQADVEANAQADPTRPDPIVVTSTPPLTLVRDDDRAAEYLHEVADIVARRQLEAKPAGSVKSVSAWLATARRNIERDHGQELIYAFFGHRSAAEAADELEPPPARDPNSAYTDTDGHVFLPGSGWVS